MIRIPVWLLILLLIAPAWFCWRYVRFSLRWSVYVWRTGNRIGIFRNKVGVIPGRWGFYVLGLEVGSRTPRDPVGLLLKRIGLWPW